MFVLWVLGGSDLRQAEQRVRSSLQRLVTMGLDYEKMFRLMDRDGSGVRREPKNCGQSCGQTLATTESWL